MARPLSIDAGRREPKIAIALGGGGARGFAHIVVLEALDELGQLPIAIAGTSMGAIVGAAYAAGIPAADLRQHAIRSFRDRTEVMTRLFSARTGRFADLFAGGRLGNPVLMDGERLLKEFWPAQMPQTFEELRIPFTAVATDYFRRERVAFSSGDLRMAVSASMAIPGMVQAVSIGDRVLVDGGAVDPVPFDELPEAADIILAIDVTGGPSPGAERKLPSPTEAALGTSQIMQTALFEGRLLRERMLHPASKVHVLRPAVEAYNALDFFSAKKIMQSSQSLKDAIGLIVSEWKTAQGRDRGA